MLKKNYEAQMFGNPGPFLGDNARSAHDDAELTKLFYWIIECSFKYPIIIYYTETPRENRGKHVASGNLFLDTMQRDRCEAMIYSSRWLPIIQMVGTIILSNFAALRALLRLN